MFFIIFQGQEKNFDFKAIWATLKRRLVKPKMKTKMKFEILLQEEDH